MTTRRLAVLLVVLAAVLPYLPTVDDYFVQDDFGVVSLLASKPAGYFPRWFVSTWMDGIWGYTPDEIRPFPALTYQLAAWWGPGSPVANHVINIAFHALNAVLVFLIAEGVAGLPLWPAAFAGLVFALLPMQTESVAWVTGRVDSMPACFYLAAFLLYARWRARPHPAPYVWALVIFFVALFTKQNAVTLPVALVLFDALVLGRPIRPSWRWLRPYVPFVALTLAYLALRYALFGEVAREGTVTADRVQVFLADASRHLRRMIGGEVGLQWPIGTVAAAVGLVVAALTATAVKTDARSRALLRPAGYFLVVWIALGVAPTLVAGYASPRHMYLASAGWALALGAALGVLWLARPAPLPGRLGGVLASAVLIFYGWQLAADVRLWGVRAEVSRRMVVDVEHEALAAPPGTLVIVDAPKRSWNYALPYALRPPFTSVDVTARARVVSHSDMSCCPPSAWEAGTRDAMRAWAADPAQPPVVALRWDASTGTLYRLDDRQDPLLRTVVSLLLQTGDGAALDHRLLDVSRQLLVRPAR